MLANFQNSKANENELEQLRVFDILILGGNNRIVIESCFLFILISNLLLFCFSFIYYLFFNNFLYPIMCCKDHVFRTFSKWKPEIVRFHSNGDSGNDNPVSASNFPLPQTHQPGFTASQLGLHIPCGWCLYQCRYQNSLIFQSQNLYIISHMHYLL